LTGRNLWRMGRMWAIVWIANTVGTLFAALFCTFTPVITPGIARCDGRDQWSDD
jgi:formate/nitrite transporter FocA (FNT family)